VVNLQGMYLLCVSLWQGQETGMRDVVLISVSTANVCNSSYDRCRPPLSWFAKFFNKVNLKQLAYFGQAPTTVSLKKKFSKIENLDFAY
jgi:hypothetical protein